MSLFKGSHLHHNVGGENGNALVQPKGRWYDLVCSEIDLQEMLSELIDFHVFVILCQRTQQWTETLDSPNTEIKNRIDDS